MKGRNDNKANGVYDYSMIKHIYKYCMIKLITDYSMIKSIYEHSMIKLIASLIQKKTLLL